MQLPSSELTIFRRQFLPMKDVHRTGSCGLENAGLLTKEKQARNTHLVMKGKSCDARIA
jgi:hypothetical protein